MTIVNTDIYGYVLDQFDDTYEQSSVDLQPIRNAVMDEWPTERPTETYSYLETAPYMHHWRRGDPRRARGFRSVKWTSDTFDWQVYCTWHKNDARDHQGRRSIAAKAMMAGENTSATDIRVVSQFFESRVDADLHPEAATATAPDGAPFFAATAGGVARFRATGGNIVDQSGDSDASVRTAYFAALQRFLLYKNPESMPLWDPAILSRGITVIYPVTMMETMAKAFQQARPFQGNVAGNAAAAPTNIILDVNLPVTLYANPYLTLTNKWYVLLNGATHKPIYKGTQQALEHHIQNDDNSDEARKEKIHGVMWDARWSYGIGPAYQTIRVDVTA